MRARSALQASQQTVELREVNLKLKPPELLAVSTQATVPVLVLENRVLDQSLDIMLWALRQNDPLGWLPTDAVDLAGAIQCIDENDSVFKPHLDRYKYPHRFGLQSGSEHRDAGAIFLKKIGLRLAQSEFLGGQSWGFLDAALAPFIRQYAHADMAWFNAQSWVRLNQWLQAYEASSAFQALMLKAPVWKAGDLPLHTDFSPHLTH
jgi:glutathione S-transferase